MIQLIIHLRVVPVGGDDISNAGMCEGVHQSNPFQVLITLVGSFIGIWLTFIFDGPPSTWLANLGCKILPGTRSLTWKVWERASAWFSLPSISKRKQFLPVLLSLSPTVYRPICLIAYGVGSLYLRSPLLGPPRCSRQSQPHSNSLHFKMPGSISTPLSHLPPQFNC